MDEGAVLVTMTVEWKSWVTGVACKLHADRMIVAGYFCRSAGVEVGSARLRFLVGEASDLAAATAEDRIRVN